MKLNRDNRSNNCQECIAYLDDTYSQEIAGIEMYNSEHHYNRHNDRETRAFKRNEHYVNVLKCKTCKYHMKKGRTVAYYEEKENREMMKHYHAHRRADVYKDLKQKKANLRGVYIGTASWVNGADRNV